jgi:hypothetical protein
MGTYFVVFTQWMMMLANRADARSYDGRAKESRTAVSDLCTPSPYPQAERTPRLE